MRQQRNFLLLERDEFKDWLDKQNVNRTIKYLQVHHTASPNYTTRKHQDEFKCLEGMRDYHMITNGWSATGQNITTFENGKIAISLDRDLNKTPAGIGGFNTANMCIENIGNFDKNGDIMTDEQKKTIVHLYACLAKKFNIPVDTDHIVYHAWYDVNGKRLSDYIPGKSKKTCPGNAWFEDGNTIAAANKGFIPAIKAELERLSKPIVPAPPSSQTISKDDEQVDKVKIVHTKDNTLLDGFMKDNKNYVCVDDLKEKGLIKATWDNINKKLYVS
ncbi:peptidoglycan recognition family protein [Paenibacillus sp. FSL E2-0178]|uniref:peptidoglycan recognition protein family protein n=1 Tax=Paenibacillus sp. FSL E2-0178 TaxID=2921361 RepID=UPI003158EC1F